MRRGGVRGNGGFTLAEVIVVMAVIGIFAAVASLSMVGFFVQGSQISRTNVARTLYLAAQNQLTELRITQGLESEFRLYYNDASLDNVSQKLGANFPDTDEENKDNVHYISKPAGIPLPDNPVFKLLAPQLIDPQVLQGAILIEFNVKTGVVMSVFYSDALADGEEFEYGTDSNDPANISGGRGMRVDGGPGYEWAEVRRQGYYGVGSTGSLDKLVLPALINVRDSYSPHSVTSISSKNILFAEILIPKDYCSDTSLSYDLLINGDVAETVTFSGINGNLASAIDNLISKSAPPIYRDSWYSLEPEYERFIWVLDAVRGNTTYRYTVDKDKNIRVGIRGGGDKTLIELTSVTEAHPYFLTEGKSAYGGSYKVASERHLHNIRYAPADSYTLAESITMSEVSNFIPVSSFTGTFNGKGNEIIDLKMNAAGGAGLFESITGEILSGKFTRVSVFDLTLTNPVVNGTVNAGALCGSLNAYVTGITINSPSVTGTYNVGGVAGFVNNGYINDITVNNPAVSGGDNVGGVAGLNGGSVTGAYVNCEDAASSITGASYIGGVAGQNDGKILDCTLISPNDIRHISGTSNTGGVTGSNGATAEIKRVLFLALAPENGSGGISPIAGVNANTDDTKLEKLYYLCGQGVRPEEVAEYNTATVTPDIGTPIGTFELFSEDVGTGWELKDRSLTEAQITSIDNEVYPYPYFDRSEAAVHPNWPIVAGMGLGTSSYSYYEKYNDSTYCFWTLEDGYANRDMLDDDKKVVEAGYVLLLDSAPVGGTYYLFAKPGDSADSSWTSAHRVTKNGNPVLLSFNANSEIAQKHGRGKYAYILPLTELAELSKNSVPLQIAYIANINGGTPDEGAVEFIQPLFAKGLYGENPNPRDPKNFYIRTPWQMSKITVLTEKVKTGGKTFIQERNLDLSQSGKANDGVMITLSNSDRSVVKHEFQGTYDGGGKSVSGFNKSFSTTEVGLFANNGVDGTIQNLKHENSIFSGENPNVAGIAVFNHGSIINCELNNVKISGNANTAGITSRNYGTGVITGTKVIDCKPIKSSTSNVAAIAGVNEGVISECEVSNTSVEGSSTAGGVAGSNTGSIIGTKLSNVTIVSAGKAAGGISATNENVIENCEVSDTSVRASGTIGGVTGSNTGSITGSKVNDVTVEGSGSPSGGIVATNENIIENCEVSNTRIKSAAPVGGIAGENKGSVTGSKVSGSTMESSGTGVGGIAGNNSNFIELCRVMASSVSGSGGIGGVAGINSKTISKSCVEFSTVKTGNGNDTVGGIVGNNQSAGTVSNVYFLSAATLENAPISNPGGGIAGSNSGSVSYALYLAPTPKSPYNKEYYPIVRSGNSVDDKDNNTTCFYLVGHRYSTNEGTTWTDTYYNREKSSADMIRVGGGQRLVTKFIDKEWLDYVYGVSFSEWFQPSVGYPYPMINGMTPPTKWVEADSPARPEQVDKDEWGTTEPTSNRAASVAFGNGDFSAAYTGAGSGVIDHPAGDRRVYIDMADVDGWYTRPVNQSDYSGYYGNFERWRMIELQEPIFRSNYVPDTSSGNYYGQYAYTNYQGKYNNPTDINDSVYRYAELNAEVQGTLYQLCPTTPGAQFYYSFYHTSRTSDDKEYADDMNFYLTGVSSTAEHADDNELVLIRPCRSPRTRATQDPVNNSKDTLINNPSVRKTVAYGNGNDLSYYKKMFTDFPANGKPYLYDVWISGLGYGITFWSVDNLSINVNGVTAINNLPADAQSHIIGYWGISYGWKHYYGLYTVPEGQERTEFAYQSRRADAQNGNYLDGISFKSPAFVSVDKYVRMNGKDVKFVKPGDHPVTVELNVKSWGEVPATNIVISDVIHPFNEYIEVVKDSISVSGSLSGSASVDSIGNIRATLNGNLAQGQEVKITFDINILKEVESTAGVSTLLFYFKNQANVTYNDSEFEAFMSKEKENNSGVVQVHIDPIKLSLDVTPEIGTSFNMDVLVEDTLVEGNSIKTTGLVNVVVPKQFAVSGSSGSVSKDPDGSSRITIKDVNLDESKKPISYSLSLTFDGSGYGVLNTTLGSDYKYLYVDEGGDPLSVKLSFPQPVVGIKAKAREFSFSLPGTSTSATILEISKEFKSMTKYADDNYDVTPEFLLFDESGKLVSDLVDNNYNITNGNYKATLMRGSDNIEYIPLNAGDYTLYYQIRLNATKPGSDKSFNLSSEIMPIKISVAGTPTSTGTSASGMSLGGEGGGLPVQLPLGAVVIAGVSFGLFDRRKKRGEHEKTC